MPVKVSTPIFLGSLTAAGALGYMAGARNNRRLPNPELEENPDVDLYPQYGKGRIRMPNPAKIDGLKDIELDDGGVIEAPEPGGAIRRRDEDGEMMEVREIDEENWGEWAELWGVTKADFREENPTGYPMSAGEISDGPHAGQVMYRPKIRGRKDRPRIYVEPGSAESLEELTEDTVDLRQAKAGKKRRRGKTKAPPVKKKAEAKKAEAKPKAKPAAKPKPEPKPEPEKATKKATKKTTKKAGKKKKSDAKLKAPPRPGERVANPGHSTAALVKRLEF